MRLWRMTFKGHYPEYVADFLGSDVECAVARAKRYFKKKGVSINTKTDLVDVILLSDKVIGEEDAKE